MKRGLQGTLMRQRTPGEGFGAFVPYPLLPSPPLDWSPALADKLERANRALGRLDGLSLLLPDLSLFLYYYVRKEAVLSSQIEGTQRTGAGSGLCLQRPAPPPQRRYRPPTIASQLIGGRSGSANRGAGEHRRAEADRYPSVFGHRPKADAARGYRTERAGQGRGRGSPLPAPTESRSP